MCVCMCVYVLSVCACVSLCVRVCARAATRVLLVGLAVGTTQQTNAQAGKLPRLHADHIGRVVTTLCAIRTTLFDKMAAVMHTCTHT